MCVCVCVCVCVYSCLGIHHSRTVHELTHSCSGKYPGPISRKVFLKCRFQLTQLSLGTPVFLTVVSFTRTV